MPEPKEQSPRSPVVELLKYPITVFSILAALIIARYALGITFGTVSKVGPGGVEFSQDAARSLADFESKLNGVLVEIDALKKSQAGERIETAQIKAKAFEASQIASDQTVALTNIASAASGTRAPVKGWIWIGDYRSKWDRPMLGSIENGQPILAPPTSLKPGTEYTVLGNTFVRDGLPANDQEYFRARRIVGTIGRGTRVRLVGVPKGIDREFAVQYWAEVEVADVSGASRTKATE